MKKIYLLTTFTIYSLLISCSNSSDDCNETLEPTGNEFTYKCNTYNTEVGRFFISPPYNEKSICIIEFVNNSYSDFILSPGDKNINLVSIRIIIPPTSYTTREIPVGTYRLKTLANNEQYTFFDIINSQVAYNSSVELSSGNLILLLQTVEDEDFNDTVVTINKTGNIYTIDYLLTEGNRQIKGRFTGEMDVVDNPN